MKKATPNGPLPEKFFSQRMITLCIIVIMSFAAVLFLKFKAETLENNLFKNYNALVLGLRILSLIFGFSSLSILMQIMIKLETGIKLSTRLLDNCIGLGIMVSCAILFAQLNLKNPNLSYFAGALVYLIMIGYLGLCLCKEYYKKDSGNDNEDNDDNGNGGSSDNNDFPVTPENHINYFSRNVENNMAISA